MKRNFLVLVPVLILAIVLPVEPAASSGGNCDWLGDPELIARCEAGGGSPGGGGIPQEWLDYGKGWKVAKMAICPDGNPRVLRQLYWLDGELWNSKVRATDFGWRFGQGDLVPNAPRRSDGSPAVFAADNLVPDVAYCVHPLDGIDLGEEIRRRAPPGETVKSPLTEGLTGLDTWLWYEGGTEIPPFTLTFTDPGSGITMQIEAWAILEAFTWDMGDGTIVTSTTPGSSDDLPHSAAATHRYEGKGDYTVTFTAGWNGTYRWRQLPGGAWSTPIPFAGNPAAISTSTPYPVTEIRAVLTP
ncbi:hypothetical protein BMS3Bbin01_00929 [bacterium BMS3Bbin01]|nr:hypothetical protein BMS3Bbin01_00929 [bacterium BMS3Bbin01]